MALELFSIDNIGVKGLNTDMTSWSLGPEYITDGVNFRILANGVYSTGGYEYWSTSDVPFNPGFLMHPLSTTGEYWLVAGRSAVQAFDGAIWSDITSLEGYSGLGTDDELLWTGCMLGKIAIINNPQSHPEYWGPINPTQKLQPLQFDVANTWHTKGYSFHTIRSHKNFLFALNLTEDGIELPGGYRWSHPADINGLPFTWDETDPSSLAGRAQLGGDSGAIVDGMSLRDSFVIYAESGIDILDYTGDEFVFQRRELSSTIGLISSNSIVEVKGVHYFIADGDIMKNDGQNVSSILHNRLTKSFTARLNADKYNRSYAVRNTAVNEVWFIVPNEDSDYPNVAYIYNYVDETWAIRDLPFLGNTGDDAIQVAFANYGPQAEPTETWDTWTNTWDYQTRPWGSARRTVLDNTIIGCTPDSKLVVLDPKTLSDQQANTRLERTDFPLSGFEQVNSVVSLYPHIVGTEPVLIHLGSQEFANGPVRWEEGVEFTPGVDKKVDVRTTGAFFCWRIESTGIGRWRMSGMDISYSKNGLR